MAGIGGYMGREGLGWYNELGQLDAYDPRTRWTPSDNNVGGFAAPNGEQPASERDLLHAKYSGVAQLGDDFFRSLGYMGNVYTPQESGSDRENQGDSIASPDFAAWMQQQGYQPADTEGYGGILDRNGRIVPGSAFGNQNNDDAGFIAGVLGLGVAGAAGGMFGQGAQTAVGGGTAGGGTGAVSAADIAFLEANGLTAAEISAVTGGQAAGFTAADLAAMSAAGTPGTTMTGINGLAPTQTSGLGDTLMNGAKSAGQWALENPQQAIQIGGILGGLAGGKGGGSSGGGGSGGGAQAGMTATPAAALERQYVAPPAGYRPGFDPEHKYFTGIGAVGAGAAGVPGQKTTQDNSLPGTRG